MSRTFGFVAALGLLILGTIAVQSGDAQTADFHYDPNTSYNCDRVCLNSIVDQYLASLVSHDPSKAPLARDVKFTENGQELKVGDVDAVLAPTGPRRSGITPVRRWDSAVPRATPGLFRPWSSPPARGRRVRRS